MENEKIQYETAQRVQRDTDKQYYQARDCYLFAIVLYVGNLRFEWNLVPTVGCKDVGATTPDYQWHVI